MPLTLRLRGERDLLACEVTGYTILELRSGGCEYLRSLLDFGAATNACDRPDSVDRTADGDDPATVLDAQTGACRASLAASVLHFLLRSPAEAALEVDGSNAAELLSLADMWCVDKLKTHVLSSLRRGMCSSFRRPTAGTSAVEAVPQVAVLTRHALDFGIGDADGSLQRLYDECVTWMATWAARAWPTRTFAGLQRAIQEDVLAAAKARVNDANAPAVLSACRQLSGVPSVAWARRIEELRGQLTSYTLSYIWSKFSEVCALAGLRQDRSECWGALLEEIRSHVAEKPDPDAAVRVLPLWASITRALLYGEPPAVADGPLVEAAAAAQGQGGSWLGEDEAAQMQDLYAMVRNYCVRHLPLVARCAVFRALSPPDQQSILLIAQEGICARLDAASIAVASNASDAGGAGTGTQSPLHWLLTPTAAQQQQQQPRGGAAASAAVAGAPRGNDPRSSAAWVIPLGDASRTPKRPKQLLSSRGGGNGSAGSRECQPPAARRSAGLLLQAMGNTSGGAADAAAAVAKAAPLCPVAPVVVDWPLPSVSNPTSSAADSGSWRSGSACGVRGSRDGSDDGDDGRGAGHCTASDYDGTPAAGASVPAAGIVGSAGVVAAAAAVALAVPLRAVAVAAPAASVAADAAAAATEEAAGSVQGPTARGEAAALVLGEAGEGGRGGRAEGTGGGSVTQAMAAAVIPTDAPAQDTAEGLESRSSNGTSSNSVAGSSYGSCNGSYHGSGTDDTKELKVPPGAAGREAAPAEIEGAGSDAGFGAVEEEAGVGPGVAPPAARSALSAGPEASKREANEAVEAGVRTSGEQAMVAAVVMTAAMVAAATESMAEVEAEPGVEEEAVRRVAMATTGHHYCTDDLLELDDASKLWAEQEQVEEGDAGTCAAVDVLDRLAIAASVHSPAGVLAAEGEAADEAVAEEGGRELRWQNIADTSGAAVAVFPLPPMPSPPQPPAAADADSAGDVAPLLAAPAESEADGSSPDHKAGGICAPQPPRPTRREATGPLGNRPKDNQDAGNDPDAGGGVADGGSTGGAHVGDSLHAGLDSAAASAAGVGAGENATADDEAVRRPSNLPAIAAPGNVGKRTAAIVTATAAVATVPAEVVTALTVGGSGEVRPFTAAAATSAGAAAAAGDVARRRAVSSLLTKSSTAGSRSSGVPVAATTTATVRATSGIAAAVCAAAGSTCGRGVRTDRQGSSFDGAMPDGRPRSNNTPIGPVAAATALPTTRFARSISAVAKPAAVKGDISHRVSHPTSAIAATTNADGGCGSRTLAVALRQRVANAPARAVAASATTTSSRAVASANGAAVKDANSRRAAGRIAQGGPAVASPAVQAADGAAAGEAEVEAPDGTVERYKVGATARPLAGTAATAAAKPLSTDADKHQRIVIAAKLPPPAAPRVSGTRTAAVASAAGAVPSPTPRPLSASSASAAKSVTVPRRPLPMSARARTSIGAVASATTAAPAGGRGVHRSETQAVAGEDRTAGLQDRT